MILNNNEFYYSPKKNNNLISPNHSLSTKISNNNYNFQKNDKIEQFLLEILSLKSEKSKLGSLYELFNNEYFTFEKLIYYLNTKEEIGIIDYLINLMYSKFINESFFYIPQLCSLIIYKKYYFSIEDYLLDRCIDKIKFSLIIYWTCSSSKLNIDKLDEMLTNIETTLVNNKRATISLFKNINKINNEIEIFQLNINKELRLNYFNNVTHFYNNIKKLCEYLKNLDISKRNNYMKKRLVKFNEIINNLYNKVNNDYNIPFNNSLYNLYHGILLPFNDHKNVNDENCNIIVGFIPELSLCYNTKSRVPIKLTVECVRVYECVKYPFFISNNDTKKENNNNFIEDNNEENYILNEANKNLNDNLKDVNKINKKEIQKILNQVNQANINIKKDIQSQQNYNKSIKTKKEDKFICNFTPEAIAFFDENWNEVIKKYKKKSKYNKFSTYTLKSFIAKSNDDLRQELFALQLIKKFDYIFKENDLNLHLYPYEILVIGSSFGLIEFLQNTISIDYLKKILPPKWDLNIFFRKFYNNNFEEAQKNFCESLAAYSLITYFLDIKDRHNGNIMLDINGNLIHIDFGFILGISPGNLNFENAPFKLTNEYVEILDGVDSGMFQYFKSLLFKGLVNCRKNYDILSQIIEITAKGFNDLPCFKGKKIKDIIDNFKNKFHFEYCEYDYYNLVDELINKSLNNWRTVQYDNFQKYTNGIKP